MNTADTILEIKKALRSAMNGILSAQMRQAGMPYKLVFGVEIPRLQAIAREFTPSRQLAQELWQQPIRECKILAAMLMPHTEFCPQMADIWADEMPTPEIAQTTAMYLLAPQPWAASLAFGWIATNSPMRQLCGFLVLARLLAQGATLNDHSLQELRDQAQSLLPSPSLHLAKAIQAVLARLDDDKIQ